MAYPIQVFLSYVEEDEQQVRLLYRKLSETGYSPWMEQENIVAGEPRDLSVKRAIRRSDFFIVCLSTNSVSKRGSVQKGIKDALDIRQEKLGDDIYIIPVRLDECEMPESLAELQWVDWFEDRGWERLLKALEIGAARRAEERDAEAILEAVSPPLATVSDPTQVASLARGPAQISSLSSSSPGPIRNRWALLVGINRYVDPAISTLNFCVNDVLEFGRMLKDLGYTVVTLHDDAAEERLLPTRENIEAELKTICDAAGEDDLVLAHFACHGKSVDGKPLLITREVRSPMLAQRGLPVAEVEKQISSKVGRSVLLLDACHVGANIGRDLSDPEFLRNVYDLAQGHAVIAASTAQQVAQEWQEKKYGVFTYYLLEALSDQAMHSAKGFVTVNDVKNYLTHMLRRWSVEHGGLIQQPTARADGEMGDIILADYRHLIRQAASVVKVANPFNHLKPITDHEELFGREAELNFIFDELSKHNNVSLVGKQQIGNSSLLQVVKLIGTERIQGLLNPVPTFHYLNLATVRNEKHFYQTLCRELGIEHCTGYDLDEALRGKCYVLCLDEIQSIAEKRFSKLISYLRATANGVGDNIPFKLIIAGRNPLGELFRNTKYESSLAYICTSWDVRPFTAAVTRKYLSEKLKSTYVTFTESEIDGLIKTSEGYPGKLRHLAAELFDKHQSRGQG